MNKLHDYKDRREINDIADWTRRLQKVQRIKLNSKLALLEKLGMNLPPGLILRTEVPHISKLKVQGNPKLRPMLCSESIKVFDDETDKEIEVTNAIILLIGAKEISWEFDPKDADKTAGDRRVEILNNSKRVCKHERVN